MQPKKKFNKTLLAGAFILAAGNTFTASAALFPVVAQAVPDVAVAPVVGTQISFGTGVIGNKVGQSCILPGVSFVSEADLMLDLVTLGANPNSANLVTSVPLSGVGTACVAGSTGQIIVIEIDGADASTVSVSVPNVTGTGWVYTPTAESCVVDFDRGTTDTQDTCVALTSNTVTGIGMSTTQANGTDATTSNELPAGATGYAAITGKTRMVLAGSLTLNADLGQGTVVSDNILVQVTYE